MSPRVHPVNTNAILNRLLAIHNCSLPVYLAWASPTWHIGDERARETLQTIAADNRATADRLAEVLLAHEGVAENGRFPMYFTGLHDLSFDYLLSQLLIQQQRDIDTMQGLLAQLHAAPYAKAVAEEALGAAKGHLQSLEELRQPVAKI